MGHMIGSQLIWHKPQSRPDKEAMKLRSELNLNEGTIRSSLSQHDVLDKIVLRSKPLHLKNVEEVGY
jgi:hypothetical protein